MQDDPVLEKCRTSPEFGEPLERIDVATHLPENFRNKEVLDAHYNTSKPENIISDVLHAQPARKKPISEVYQVFEKISMEGM